MDRNSTSFNAQLQQFFRNIDFDPSTNPLRYVQFVVKTYIDQVIGGKIINAGRGLIINHTMGIGKTITAIELMETLRLLGYRVICIGPKATADNLDVNVAKWSKITGRQVLRNADGTPAYKYLTMRANNLAEQIKREAFVPTIDGRKVGNVPASATLTGALNKTVVVIDEAHLFCNSVAHGRTNAVDLYRALMNAKDCFVFLLTGTLVVNSPFEAVPAINLVLGRSYLPESEDDFNERYGTPELIQMNGATIQNISTGLISYAAIDIDDPSFPRKLRTRVVMLEMGPDQFAKYVTARQIEASENKSAGIDDRDRRIFIKSFEGADKLSSSYRVRSRIASNGSNKIEKICEIVASHPDELTIVHCPFVENGGVHDVAEGLSTRLNYREMIIRDGKVVEGPKNIDVDAGVDSPVPAHDESRWFFILRGDTNDKATIAKLLSIINCPNNRYGAYCHVLVMTSVGSVGLDLKNGRNVIYMSPSWNLEEFNQTVSRYVRLNASDALPVEKRTVQPYILVSIEPKDDVGVRRPSTDEHLLDLSMMKMRANNSFMTLLRSVSIECLAGIAPDPTICRHCLANDMPLSIGTHKNDIIMPNNCVDPREKIDPAKTPMQSMEVTDGTHVYDIRFMKTAMGNYLIYEFDPASLQYIKLERGHPLYNRVLEVLP